MQILEFLIVQFNQPSTLLGPNIILSTCSQAPVLKHLFSSTCSQAPVLKHLFSSTCSQAPVLKHLFSSTLNLCSSKFHFHGKEELNDSFVIILVFTFLDSRQKYKDSELHCSKNSSNASNC
jgi:hypothetical protein